MNLKLDNSDVVVGNIDELKDCDDGLSTQSTISLASARILEYEHKFPPYKLKHSGILECINVDYFDAPSDEKDAKDASDSVLKCPITSVMPSSDHIEGLLRTSFSESSRSSDDSILGLENTDSSSDVCYSDNDNDEDLYDEDEDGDDFDSIDREYAFVKHTGILFNSKKTAEKLIYTDKLLMENEYISKLLQPSRFSGRMKKRKITDRGSKTIIGSSYNQEQGGEGKQQLQQQQLHQRLVSPHDTHNYDDDIDREYAFIKYTGFLLNAKTRQNFREQNGNTATALLDEIHDSDVSLTLEDFEGFEEKK